MSIVDENKQENGAAAPAATARPNFGGQAQADIPELNIGALFNPLGGRASGDTLVKLAAAATKFLEPQSNNRYYEYAVVPLDREALDGIAVSALVVVARLKLSNGKYAAFHTLIIGDTWEPIETTINNGPNSITWQRHAGEAFDGKMVDVINRELGTRFPGTRFIQADAEVIPVGFKVDDEVRTNALITHAITACASTIGQAANLTRVNIDQLTGNRPLQVRPTYHQPNTENAVGLPVRTDTKLNLVAVPTRQSNSLDASVHDLSGQTRTIAQVGGFMDVIYNPEEKQNNSFRRVERKDYRTFLPQFIITQIGHSQLSTISSVLLALAPVNALRTNNGWMPCFRPNPTGTNGRDMHSIGALNVEANITDDPNGGTILDTGKDLRDDQIGQFLGEVMYSSLVVSIDVPECGPETHSLAAFAMAAEGDQGAYEAIIAQADELTKNHFSKIFAKEKTQDIIVKNELRLFNGWYVAPDGTHRDIRDVDYLWVANTYGDKDTSQIVRWSDAVQKTDTNEITRAVEQRSIIENSIAAEVHFTGMSRRYSFTPEFLDALSDAMVAAGLEVSLALNSMFGVTTERANGSYLDRVSSSTRESSNFFHSRTSGGQSATFGRFRRI